VLGRPVVTTWLVPKLLSAILYYHYSLMNNSVWCRAIVLAYNIPGVKNLVLTREQVVGIYNGSINNWNDTIFTEHNPEIDLPNATIVPVARLDSSGSTEIFTKSLSSFSDAWATRYGAFSKSSGWDASVVKLLAERNSGVSDKVKRQPYRIGYMTRVSAVEVNLPFASMVNQRGRITTASKRSVQAAMDERSHMMSSRLTAHLCDGEGEETYPIASYSYFIVSMTHAGNCSVAIELARYIEWFLDSSQAEEEAENHFKVPISRGIADRIHSDILEQMTCNQQLLMDLVRHQKYEEEESLKTWKLPVQIVSPLIAFIVLLLIIYAVRQRVKYLQMLNRDDWKINFSDIDFVLPKKRHRDPNIEQDTRTSLQNYTGLWNVHVVAIRPLSIAPVFRVNQKLKQELMRMCETLEQENIAKFFGVSAHNDTIYLVEQHCSNGTLVNFIQNNKYSVNESFRYVASADIANGMAYLHRQNLIHGNLSINKCHVDSRWTIKIIDWEYTALYDVIRRTGWSEVLDNLENSVLYFLCEEWPRACRHLAPEIQKDGRLLEPTRAGDVYSFGFIIHDLFIDMPDWEIPQTSSEVDVRIPNKARWFMEQACHETAIKRPTFEQLEKSLRSSIGGEKMNLLDRCVYVLHYPRLCMLLKLV